MLKIKFFVQSCVHVNIETLKNTSIKGNKDFLPLEKSI